MKKLIPLSIALLRALATGAGVEFPPHPRLVFTAEEIKHWRSDPTRKSLIDAIIKKGERELKTPIVVPEKGGQWVFYYACPRDSAYLKPLSDREHQCPVCKKIYTDERTIAAYRTILHNRANTRCYNLALAYAFTDNEKFAKPVRETLLKYAQLYPHYQRHDRWGRKGALAVVGGRRYCQHLSEAVGIIKMAKAYDLIYNFLSPPDRKRIEKNFLVATVREILKYNIFNPGKNNHQTWFNAGYAVVGVACGDAELVHIAVNGPKGFHAQLQKSLTADGIWYEGTISYHFYALQAMEEIVDAVRRIGWDLTRNTRLKEMFLTPLKLAYPNGRLPALSDGDPVSLRSYRSRYRWAYEHFGDELFKPLAEGKSANLLHRSIVMKDIGLAILRRNRNYTLLDYGKHGGGHGHPDKLNLVLYALDRELILDPGRITYSVPEYETWARQTVAHNTVVINRCSQRPAQGKLLLFQDTNCYSACLASAGSAYPTLRQYRFLLLTDNLLIDAYSLHSSKEVEMDWLVHSFGELHLSIPSSPRKDPLGTKAGYQHLSDLKEARGTPQFFADLSFEDGRLLRIHFIGDTDSTVFIGTGIGYRLNQRIPFLLRRRKTEATCFLTLYDLTGTGEFVRTVRTLPVLLNGKMAKPWQVAALELQTPKGELLIALNFTPLPATIQSRTFSHLLFLSP